MRTAPGRDRPYAYLALWNRLDDFTIPDLTTAIEDRSLVRSTLMRATQLIVSTPDFRLIRPAVAALLRRVQRNAFSTRTTGVDLDELVAAARSLLADGRVLTRPELGKLLTERWPVPEPTALGWTAQYLLPVVHPAPSGTWQTYGPTPFAAWFDVPARPDLKELVRLLPEFDAPLLAYADRRRVMTDEIRRAVCVGAAVESTVLVDGTVAATWNATEDGILTVHPFRRLSTAEKVEITAEALALLDFTHPGQDHDVRHRSATAP